ncbi:hypothetical protein J1N35_001111 [Gossypium stocksii]|uniref:Uncharacterized protein n=1 Tax=Gossypium stocksii TaxID=47602 RepID=A0A9D3WJT3_9ROSI|nr:hypothetical protein J1N35_001111 [Gossypium stocksii]
MQVTPQSGQPRELFSHELPTNVTGQSSKPVTITPNASDGGLLLRWGSFGLRELARFKELLEKPIRLKPSWPDDEYMAT